MTVDESCREDLNLGDDDNVVMLHSRLRAAQTARRTSRAPMLEEDMKRFPVDIRGNVTFGRLMSGLATVGLTVRVDARSGRVIIADDVLG